MSTLFLCIFSRKKIFYLEWDISIFFLIIKYISENQINLVFLLTYMIFILFPSIQIIIQI